MTDYRFDFSLSSCSNRDEKRMIGLIFHTICIDK